MVGNDALAMPRPRSWPHWPIGSTWWRPRRFPHSPWLDKLASFDNVTILEGYTVVNVAGAPYLEAMIVAAPGGGQQEIAIKGTLRRTGADPQHRPGASWWRWTPWAASWSTAGARPAGPASARPATSPTATPGRMLITVGDGAKTALSAYEYLLRRRQPGTRTRVIEA